MTKKGLSELRGGFVPCIACKKRERKKQRKLEDFGVRL